MSHDSEDTQERVRMKMAESINSAPMTRAELESIYGADNVWDTTELKAAFNVRGFLAPFCSVERKSDGRPGAVVFQHEPRYYFNFTDA